MAEYVNKRLRASPDLAVTSDEVEQWESGKEGATVEQTEALAGVLFLPFYGLLEGAGDMLAANALDFRRGPNGNERRLSYETHAKIERFNGFYRLAKELALVTAAIEDISVPPAPNPKDTEATGEAIAAALGMNRDARLSWESEEGALRWLTNAVEATGVFVFSLSLDVDEVRGASKWEPSGPPAVLIDTADSVAARLFTLAHEFAHLVRGHPEHGVICDPSTPKLEPEAWANRVAGATLIPRGEILDAIGPHAELPSSYREWPFALRQALRRRFRVSHDVLGIRLLHLGVVNDAGLTKGFWRRKAGFARSTGTLAKRYRRYLGARTIELARTALHDEALTAVEIARILDIRVEHVEEALQAQ